MSGRLLLRADGVLAEQFQFSPLDPDPPYIPPARWDGPHVLVRFSEGLATVARIPAQVRPNGFRTLWPRFQSEWADMLSMLGDGGDAYENWTREQNFSVRQRPSAKQVADMETVLLWPGTYLRRQPTDVARAFQLSALAMAREVSIEDLVKRGRHHDVKAPAIWLELAQQAAHEVAVGLRIDRVAVF